jgi:sugar lactone lactonase YvrE
MKTHRTSCETSTLTSALGWMASLTLLGSAACGSSGGAGGMGGAGGSAPLQAGDITTIAGTGEEATQPSDADGNHVNDPAIPHDRARFDTPMDTMPGPAGTLLILDWNGHKIRRLTPDGMVEFVVGTGIEGDACESPRADGSCPLAASELNHMTDVVFDATGRLVIAAWHNAKIKIADVATDSLRDACGSGTRKFAGDGGPCVDASGVPLVSFDLPCGLAYDQGGNLLIADQANQVIRRLDTDGMVKTIAGHCPSSPGFGCTLGQGYSGDGGLATEATLRNTVAQSADPQGKIALDAAGNLYIADSGNNVVRRVVPGDDGILGSGDATQEIITTFAGTGIKGATGDGGPATAATLSGPRDVAVGSDGSLYIADTGNNCVRRVGIDGVIATVAGQCGQKNGFAGDGGPATQALLAQPYGVAIDADGNLIIADSANNRIRKVLAH